MKRFYELNGCSNDEDYDDGTDDSCASQDYDSMGE